MAVVVAIHNKYGDIGKVESSAWSLVFEPVVRSFSSFCHCLFISSDSPTYRVTNTDNTTLLLYILNDYHMERI